MTLKIFIITALKHNILHIYNFLFLQIICLKLLYNFCNFIFNVLYCIWYADHTVYPEHGMYRDTCRRVPSDRIPVVLLKKEAESLSFFFTVSHSQKMNYARSTFPDFRHLAQTYIVWVPPFTLQRTDLMFDLNILFDLL